MGNQRNSNPISDAEWNKRFDRNWARFNTIITVVTALLMLIWLQTANGPFHKWSFGAALVLIPISYFFHVQDISDSGMFRLIHLLLFLFIPVQDVWSIIIGEQELHFSFWRGIILIYYTMAILFFAFGTLLRSDDIEVEVG